MPVYGIARAGVGRFMFEALAVALGGALGV